MENEIENKILDDTVYKKPVDNKCTLPAAIVIAGIIIAGAMIYNAGTPASMQISDNQNVKAVLIDAGRILPLETEEKMLKILISNGTIDPSKLSQVTELNLLWAYGLANKNPVLEEGPIMDTRYGGPNNMASVGGWTVTTGLVMDHYAKHTLTTLTPDQQSLVEKIANGIFRPCCNNSTHFPDCNHGMAMLGLLEYLAAQGATEEEMWNTAMTANMSWFPDQYQTVAQYLKIKGIALNTVTPQILLGAEYSSGSGFAKIAAQVPQTNQQRGGSGCGVEAAAPAQRQQGGCDI